jgi:hypothetical protein
MPALTKFRQRATPPASTSTTLWSRSPSRPESTGRRPTDDSPPGRPPTPRPLAPSRQTLSCIPLLSGDQTAQVGLLIRCNAYLLQSFCTTMTKSNT